MEAYIYVDAEKACIVSKDNMSDKELYDIANSFICFLMFNKEQVDLSKVKKEVIDKICELLQAEMNTSENDLNVLLQMTDDYLVDTVRTKARTLTEKNM